MIGWFENDSNNVMSGMQKVFLLSSVSNRYAGMYFEKADIRRTLSVYTARRLSAAHSWQIHDDVYLSPEKR
jgi:hypothetical protein